MKDLIQRLRSDNYMEDEVRSFAREAADALERLTAGDVEFPSHPAKPMIMGWSELETKAIIDYGNRRAAAARKAMREEAAMVCQLYGERTISKEGFDCAQAIRGIEP
jgi:hypothetical protein